MPFAAAFEVPFLPFVSAQLRWRKTAFGSCLTERWCAAGPIGPSAGGAEAYFGHGTKLEAQTTLATTSSSAPVCVLEGFTGETNNLKLAHTPALGTQPLPTMVSRQTNGDVFVPATLAQRLRTVGFANASVEVTADRLRFAATTAL